MKRAYNFSAGPATLPEEVINQIKEDIPSWDGLGFSVMETGHRTAPFMELVNDVKARARALYNVPNNYQILLLHGGASAQFFSVPMNLLGDNKQADYFNTGHWSKMAIQEAQKYCDVNIVASLLETSGVTDEGSNGSASNLNIGENRCADASNQVIKENPSLSSVSKFYSIPDPTTWKFNSNAAYVHMTSNETLMGLEFQETPDTGNIPLVADMTSCIYSKPIDISKYGVIYAGAQKNIGIAGLAMVIVRDDLLDRALSITPSLYNYGFQANKESLFNTPSTFSIYVMDLVFKWQEAQGGLSEINKINHRKALKLYDFIDNSEFYSNYINPSQRSDMNVTFSLENEGLNDLFLQQAGKNNIVAIKGHRVLGGMRASIYNAMPEAGVDALIEFMKEFEFNVANNKAIQVEGA